MVRRIILTQLGRLEVDDRDYYGNKRMELAVGWVTSGNDTIWTCEQLLSVKVPNSLNL